MNGRTSKPLQGRGAALLIVLGTLVLVTTTVAMLAGAASAIQSRTNIDRLTVNADDMLTAAEGPIQQWLFASSGTIVLPPEISMPRVNVLHDRFWIDDVECELQITAWDQFGMVPLELIRSGSPLRVVVPTEIMGIVESAQLAADRQAGLDLYIGMGAKVVSDARNWEDRGFAISPFPQPEGGWGGAAQFGANLVPASNLGIEGQEIAFGDVIATHNHLNNINVNTAPIALVDAALRESQRGGLDQIIASRTAGKPASVPAGRSVNRSSEQIAPQLVGSSNVWSFRIDARVGTMRKSWWATYAPPRHGSGRTKTTTTQSGMECVQRLVISH